MLVVLSAACAGKSQPDSAASALKRVHFDYNSASLTPQMTRVLENNSRYLKKHKNLDVVLEGHCDERGTNEYNLALGDRRSASVKSYLERQGVGRDRMRTVSYGEEKPLERGGTEASWYLNRRVEFTRKGN